MYVMHKRVQHKLGLCGKDILVILLEFMYSERDEQKGVSYLRCRSFCGHIQLSFMVLEGKLLSSCFFLDYFLFISNVLCSPD